MSPKRVFRIAIGGPIRTIDPLEIENSGELILVSNLAEPLLAMDPKTGLLLLSAAEKYTVSQDGLKITLSLRNDLYWSTGKKIVAQDFIYAFRRLLASSKKSSLSERFEIVKGADEFAQGAIMDPGQLGFKAMDTLTLIIELKRPSSSFLNVLTEPGTSPIPKETVDRFGSAWVLPKNWVSSGPFIPVDKKEDLWILRKNPHHRLASTIEIDEVEVRLVDGGEEGTQLYLEGKVDQFGHRDLAVPSRRIPSLAGRNDLVFQPDLRTYFLRLNTNRIPVSQLKIRQAFAMAVDRSLLLSGIGLDEESLAFSLVPDGIKMYEAPRGYLFSVAQAKKILKDLGYCVVKEFSSSCRSFPYVTLIHVASDKKRKIALMLETMIRKNLGLEGLSISALPLDDFLKKVASGDYVIALDDLAVLSQEPFGFLDAFRKRKASLSGFNNPEFDELLDQAERATNFTDSKALFRRAEALLLRDAAVIPLFHGTNAVLISSKLKGYFSNIWDLHPFAEISLLP